MTTLYNSRKALEAAEFARTHGAYHALHTKLFEAYFSDGKNIADTNILLEAAAQCGLPVEELESALANNEYEPQVTRGSHLAIQHGVTAIPSFFVEGMPPLIGAVSEDYFREKLSLLAT